MKKIAAIAIVGGTFLYLSKFLRPLFLQNSNILFILGFLPNLGLSFAIPFIYVTNRLRQNKPVKHFHFACIVSFLLMILNEIRDKFQKGRVFDQYDIYASFIGVSLAYIVFNISQNSSRKIPQ